MSVRILIVDDNPLIRQGLRRLLEAHAGFEVAGEAADGAEALTLLTLVQPDVMLLDLRMPRMSGFEVMRRWRCRQDATRVLVMAAVYEDAATRQAVLRLGAVGYLSKSALGKALIQAIEEAMA